MTYQYGRQQFPPRGGPASSGRSFNRQTLSLPTDYLKNGYFDSNGHILPEVIIEWPRDIAKNLDIAGIGAAQIRNFFGEARRIEGQLSSGQGFDALRGRILQLDAYAASAQTRGNAPPLFKQFIEQNLKWAAKDRKSFVKGFILHFECVVAYFPKK
jgi:hypothetical protein